MVDVQITVTSDCGVSLEDSFTFNASIIGEYTKWARIWCQGYTTFTFSDHLSIKFLLFVNVKMPTIVGILTFISRVNTPTECIKLWENLNFQYFSFLEVEISCTAEFSMNLFMPPPFIMGGGGGGSI